MLLPYLLLHSYPNILFVYILPTQLAKVIPMFASFYWYTVLPSVEWKYYSLKLSLFHPWSQPWSPTEPLFFLSHRTASQVFEEIFPVPSYLFPPECIYSSYLIFCKCHAPEYLILLVTLLGIHSYLCPS